MNKTFGKIILASAFVLAGCCNKETIDSCRKDALSSSTGSEITHAQESAGVAEVMRLDIKETPNVRIVAELLRAECISGKGGQAKVKISWQANIPDLDTVRASVETAGVANKVWVESGASGEGITGPWVENGLLIRLTNPKSGDSLGEVRATALPCEEGKNK